MPTQNPISTSGGISSIDNGSCNTITDFTTISTTVADVTGSNFTLANIGKYLVNINIYSQGGTLASDLLLDIYTAANVIVPRTKIRILAKVANYQSSGSISVIIDNTVAGTSYKLRGNCGSGIHSISNGSQGNSGITWIQLTGLGGVSAATLRTINRVTLLNNALNLQSEFQAAYDAEIGINAPDPLVPQAVVNAANALNNSNYKIYLAHNNWYYQNFTNTATTSNWSIFGAGGKSNFGAALPANHIFTFK